MAGTRTRATLSKLFSSQHVRRAAVIIAALVCLWIFRTHLRDLAAVLWPIIVASAVYGFREELSALLRRLRRVSKQGAEFGEVSINAQITWRPVDQALKEIVPEETIPPYVEKRVQDLRTELNSRMTEDVEKREHLLMLRLAQAQQNTAFGLIWLRIFASQLEALTSMAGEQRPVDLMPFYDLHVSRTAAGSTEENKISALSFEAWSNYFTQTGIAIVSDHMGTATLLGVDFLKAASNFNLPRFQIL